MQFLLLDEPENRARKDDDEKTRVAPHRSINVAGERGEHFDERDRKRRIVGDERI